MRARGGGHASKGGGKQQSAAPGCGLGTVQHRGTAGQRGAAWPRAASGAAAWLCSTPSCAVGWLAAGTGASRLSAAWGVRAREGGALLLLARVGGTGSKCRQPQHPPESGLPRLQKPAPLQHRQGCDGCEHLHAQSGAGAARADRGEGGRVAQVVSAWMRACKVGQALQGLTEVRVGESHRWSAPGCVPEVLAPLQGRQGMMTTG